jgi:hypothetical protein
VTQSALGHLIPDHVLPTFNCELQPVPVLLLCYTRQEVVRRNPVRAASKDVDPIHPEIEAFANLIFVLNKIGSSDAGLLNDLIQKPSLVVKLRPDLIQRLGPIAIRIPELRILWARISFECLRLRMDRVYRE